MNPTDRFLVDFRCPDCDRPVTGTIDVEYVAHVPQVEMCQHCHRRLTVQKDDAADLGGSIYSYEPAQE